MYQQYLKRLEKEIHDEKMKRFVEHAQHLSPGKQSPLLKNRRERKPIDTGLNK